MKIHNKRNYVYVRVILFFICVCIVPILFIVGTLFKIILFSVVFILLGIGIFIKYTEFDNSGECLSIRKFYFFQSGYIRPKIEIPKIYLNDYSIKKVLWIYDLHITIDHGSSKKRIKITLWCFNQFEIIKIAKTLENIRKENNVQEMRILSEPAFKNKFANTEIYY
ncbi:hypothetical protein D3C71_34010 [compost metagenome]